MTEVPDLFLSRNWIGFLEILLSQEFLSSGTTTLEGC
jgi:hypothetical protein